MRNLIEKRFASRFRSDINTPGGMKGCTAGLWTFDQTLILNSLLAAYSDRSLGYWILVRIEIVPCA